MYLNLKELKEKEKTVMRTGFRKDVVNDAIYDVITKQFKKDCKEAHQLVEDAGYRIVKIEGGWKVSNPETGKYVFVRTYNWYRRGYEICRNTTFGKLAYANEVKADCKFDFVGCLDCERQPLRENWSRFPNKALEQWDRLSDAKWRINWRKKSLKETEEKIEQLQKDLIRYAREIANAENDLKAVRNELGLAK